MNALSPKCEAVEYTSELLSLPNELLVLIFQNVNENHQIASVCKKFQCIISNMESKSKILVIKDEKTVSKCSQNFVTTGSRI